MQTARFLTGVKRNSTRRRTAQTGSTLTTVGNEGARLHPLMHGGPRAPGGQLLIEMEIQEVMLQREEVSRSPCQSVCLFILRCFITVTFCTH